MTDLEKLNETLEKIDVIRSKFQKERKCLKKQKRKALNDLSEIEHQENKLKIREEKRREDRKNKRKIHQYQIQILLGRITKE